MFKVGLMILNAMFLLLFISAVIGEWGKPSAIVSGIAIVSIIINSIYILAKTTDKLEG